jgi:hypothetical protein
LAGIPGTAGFPGKRGMKVFIYFKILNSMDIKEIKAFKIA